ncbi:sensor histidine kinase [Heyndrickxia vini]|uniref:Heme sensor protein HssS n=1 Tax=Heyndrickxia vini TaxID=1476025 RepID=A0ABX7E3X2_9BACI|nr:HAMP domain-containing sensor histidine kinase [Heyndrickxia vini]QQZ09979.1 HAMP domain-containing protein [Heyndrickxia vini]
MKTLYVRIVWTTIFVMLFSALLSFFISNLYYHYFLKSHNDQKVTNMVEDVLVFFEKHSSSDSDTYLDYVGRLGYQLYIVDTNGKGKFYGGDFREKKLSPTVIQNVLQGNVYHGIKEFPSRLFVTGFFDNSVKNTIGVPITIKGTPHALFMRPNLEAQFGEMRIFFAVLLVFTILLSIVFVIISTRYIVKPIVKLTDATKKLTKGNYNIQLNVKRKDEIGQLASHFSEMTKSLKQLEEMRQEFVSNVSHEIQSPLASIQGFSQTLRSKKLSDEQQEKYLSIIEDESRRMSQLSKQLLTLASLDKEEGILEKERFDVADQVKQVLFMTEWSWRDKDIAIDMELPSTYIEADKKLLHQVWTNLITNSIKYTEPGGAISLEVHANAETCIVKIQDTGIGIAEEDLSRIFQRFYKVDKARNRKEGSSGLGLAITQKIIELHGGKIQVDSQLGRGTTFIITLPNV